MFRMFSVEGGVASPEGFFADGVHSGLKPENALDTAFIYSEKEAKVEAVFTTNKMKAAPLQHFIKNDIKTTNFILINSKNANALNGQKGLDDIEEIFSELSQKYDLINPIMSSTGVIGSPLPTEKIINSALNNFDLTARNSYRSAVAIMTTDTRAKRIAFRVELRKPDSDEVREYFIGGIAKGAGMINPSMATMLAFITTDLDVPREDMKKLLQKYTKNTFNAISVDGDTSTNDSIFLLSNGKKDFYDEESFAFALERVMEYLAFEVIKDGEGVNHVVGFDVTGAKNNEEAEKVSKALSNSLLVKTAIFGKDPNWGRIASTVGASGVECAEDKLSILYEDLLVFDRGTNMFNSKTEEQAFKIMSRDQFTISVDLGIGNGYFKSYGTDLSYDYVKINADYRT